MGACMERATQTAQFWVLGNISHFRDK